MKINEKMKNKLEEYNNGRIKDKDKEIEKD
jgi:hypothetical protein